jgi:ABC-type multidrug transport system ATPase subunit
MPIATIIQLRNQIRKLNYVVSTHATEELEDDNLTILDLENIILTGQITERQRDSKTREHKYVITGITLDGSQAQTVAKIGFTGKLIVITVYVL